MASQEPVIRWVEINDDLTIALFPNPVRPDGAPPGSDDPDNPRYGIFDSPFSTIFMIRVKSNSDIGRFAHDNLLGLLLGDPGGDPRLPQEVADQVRALFADAGITAASKVVLLRANAELPANPKRRSVIGAATKNPGTVAAFDWKDKDPRSAGPSR